MEVRIKYIAPHRVTLGPMSFGIEPTLIVRLGPEYSFVDPRGWDTITLELGRTARLEFDRPSRQLSSASCCWTVDNRDELALIRPALGERLWQRCQEVIEGASETVEADDTLSDDEVLALSPLWQQHYEVASQGNVRALPPLPTPESAEQLAALPLIGAELIRGLEEELAEHGLTLDDLRFREHPD